MPGHSSLASCTNGSGLSLKKPRSNTASGKGRLYFCRLSYKPVPGVRKSFKWNAVTLISGEQQNLRSYPSKDVSIQRKCGMVKPHLRKFNNAFEVHLIENRTGSLAWNSKRRKHTHLVSPHCN